MLLRRLVVHARACAFVSALAFDVVPAAAAQTRATSADLAGVVRDATGGVLPGATVTATNVATSQARSTVTDGEGRFLLPALVPGTYDLAGTLDGFTEARQTLTLTLGSRLDVALVLQVAGTVEQVTVSAAGPLLDAQRTVVATVVAQPQIERLPIDGRNFSRSPSSRPASTPTARRSRGRRQHRG